MKMSLYTSIFSLILGLLFLVPFATVQAQFTDNVDPDSIIVESSPDNPKPGETITVTVKSFSVDLDRSTITWSANGSRGTSGVGLKSFSTKMGSVGTQTRVSVGVRTSEGKTFSQTLTFSPATVLLIWESESYVPPLYKGKALLSRYSNAKIVAIPQLGRTSTTLSPKNLIYTWKKNGRNMASVSGYGKNVLEIDRYTTAEDTTIEVVVSNASGSLHAEGEIVLSPVEPKLLTYIYSPVYGTIFNTALTGNYKISSKEISLSTVPYFFNGGRATPIITDYTWSMNGQPATDISDIITFRNDASTTGMVSIGVKASHAIGSVIESDTNSFSLTF